MDRTLLRTALVLLALHWTCARSDPALSVYCNSKDPALTQRVLTEGESLWFYPQWANPNNRFLWYHNASQGPTSNNNMDQEVTQVSKEDEEPVYATGPELVLLNATGRRCGCYMAQEMKNGSVFRTHFLQVNMVLKNSSERHFGPTIIKGTNAMISCPDPVAKACKVLNGTFSWYKDDVLLPERHSKREMVTEPGLYDCVCTWIHRSQLYHSVGARPLIYQKPSGLPIPVKILDPVDKERPATKGEQLQLRCTVRCGANINPFMCKAWWKSPSSALNSEGYNLTIVRSPSGSEETIVTEILTIERVSPQDFEHEFLCAGKSPYGGPVYSSFRLVPRALTVTVTKHLPH